MPEEESKFKKWAATPCSDDFAIHFCHSSSILVECTACGREHYNAWEEGSFEEEGEFARLTKMNEEDPDACQAHEQGVRWGTLAGHQVIFDCPCNFARWYEDEIWFQRSNIAEYVKTRATRELADAKRGMRTAQTLEKHTKS